MMVFNPKKELNPDPVPAGKYVLVLDGCEESKTSKGDDMYVLKWRIKDGGPSDEDYGGRKLFDNMVMKDSAGFRIAQIYQAVHGDDIDMDFKNVREAFLAVLEKLENGQTVKAGLTISEYKDKKNNKVDRYLHSETSIESNVPF